MRRALIPALVGAVIASAVVAATPASAVTAAGSGYVPLPAPVRVLDTRTTVGGHLGKIPAKGTVTFTARASDAGTETAAVLNLTVTGATASGHITAYPAGTALPTTSNLNFLAGEIRPNLTVVKVASTDKGDDQVTVYNGSPGTIDLVADLSGAFTGTDGEAAGTFVPMAPTRLLDTRTTTGGHKAVVASKKSMSFPVGGVSSIPADASAAVLNLTVTSTLGSGYATAYPAGASVPTASNLNFAKGQTLANLAVVPLGSGGDVSLYNGSTGSVNFVADVAGYFIGGVPAVQGAFGALAPTRLLDTNTATGGHDKPVAKDETVSLPVTGKAGVPSSDIAAVVLNVTVAATTAVGHLTVYGSGSTPLASNLNFVKGESVPNLVVAAPDSSGNVHLYNGSSGTLRLVVDISGYVLRSDLPTPAVSVSHYIRNITDGASADQHAMGSLGAADTTTGSKLVVLDIGAQTNNSALPSPGVALTGFPDDHARRLTYAQLVSALNAYLASFTVNGATVAIATNSDGDWTAYKDTTRAADWWTAVIHRLNPAPGVTVEAADDIEAGFLGTVSQALQWESTYLATAATATVSPAGGTIATNLLFIGDAAGCPTAFGSTASCAWTQAQEYQLAGGKNPTRIQALPQIYLQSQARQWANVDHTGGSKIAFLGALTEHAADPAGSFVPAQGYAALWNALSAIKVTPPAVVTDLDIRS